MIKIAYALKGESDYKYTEIEGNVTPQMVVDTIRLKYEMLNVPIISLSWDNTENPVTIRLMIELNPFTKRMLTHTKLEMYERKIIDMASGPGISNVCPGCRVSHEIADILFGILNPFRMTPYFPREEDTIRRPLPLHPMVSFSRN